MPERKIWTQKQDTILRHLKEERGLKKWSQIAKTMDDEFFVKGRTGKQCRQRYHNHLDSKIITTEWTNQEEMRLFDMHEEVGNKWSIISQKLTGRSDNCVKNHFYSKLRKSTRKLNKMIQQKYRKELKEIKISLLYKIIETTEQRFKNNSKIDEEIIEKCISIKNRLFKHEWRGQSQGFQEQLNEQAKGLIDDIFWFDGKIKRTSKPLKEHKSSLETCYSKSNNEKLENYPIFNEDEEKPFYEIFMRVCKEILQEKN